LFIILVYADNHAGRYGTSISAVPDRSVHPLRRSLFSTLLLTGSLGARRMHPAADVTYLLRRAVVRRASCRSCTLLVQLQKTIRQELAYYDEAVESARVRLRSGIINDAAGGLCTI
jgi:hypothetical protein